MTTEELRDLVRQWRESAVESRYLPDKGSEAYEQCADELEAVLNS